MGEPRWDDAVDDTGLGLARRSPSGRAARSLGCRCPNAGTQQQTCKRQGRIISVIPTCRLVGGTAVSMLDRGRSGLRRAAAVHSNVRNELRLHPQPRHLRYARHR